MILPKSRQASTHSGAPWVVIELAAALCSIASRSGRKNMGIGASRMIDPLPADEGRVEPEFGIPDRL